MKWLTLKRYHPFGFDLTTCFNHAEPVVLLRLLKRKNRKNYYQLVDVCGCVSKVIFLFGRKSRCTQCLTVANLVWIKEHHFKVDNHTAVWVLAAQPLTFQQFFFFFFFFPQLSCWHLEKAIVAEWDRIRCTTGAFQILFLRYHKVDIHPEKEGWGSL